MATLTNIDLRWRIASAIAGVLVPGTAVLGGAILKIEPPLGNILAVASCIVALVLGTVCAHRLGRRWWPWLLGAFPSIGLSFVGLAWIGSPRSETSVRSSDTELADKPIPAVRAWVITGVVIACIGAVLSNMGDSEVDRIRRDGGLQAVRRGAENMANIGKGIAGSGGAIFIVGIVQWRRRKRILEAQSRRP